MSALLSSERLDRAALERAIARTLGILHPGGETWEIRAPKMGRQGTVSGYYNDAARCARDVATQLDAKAPGVYVTINPVKRDLLARAFNHLQERAETATGDAEIVCRRWLPLDFDPQRPPGISATDAEHDAALTRAEEIAEYLTGRGWPAPVRADSGNGAHLLYPIDLPNEEDARQLVERVLKGLAAFCDDARDADPCIQLDTTLGNAARILKLYPTMARKGDALPDRPHRRSALLDVPERAEIVTRAQLEELANELCPPSATAKARPDAQSSHGRQWIDDLGRYLSDRGIAVASERDATNAHKWVLEACVWNPAHTDHSAWLLQFPGNGAIAAGCSHNSCQGKRWPDFRDTVEPGWRATTKYNQIKN